MISYGTPALAGDLMPGTSVISFPRSVILRAVPSFGNSALATAKRAQMPIRFNMVRDRSASCAVRVRLIGCALRFECNYFDAKRVLTVL